jgi:hypothetical protein
MKGKNYKQANKGAGTYVGEGTKKPSASGKKETGKKTMILKNGGRLQSQSKKLANNPGGSSDGSLKPNNKSTSKHVGVGLGKKFKSGGMCKGGC